MLIKSVKASANEKSLVLVGLIMNLWVLAGYPRFQALKNPCKYQKIKLVE